MGGHAFSHLAGNERVADLGLRKLTEAFTSRNLMKKQLDWSITCLGSVFCQPSTSTGAHPIRYQNPRMLKSFIPMVQYLHITYTQPSMYFKSPLDYLRWRRQWQPTPVLLPGKSHGWRRLVGCSPWGREESDTTERLHFHFSLSCIGEGNGNPLQYYGLENPMDCIVYGVTKSRPCPSCFQTYA